MPRSADSRPPRWSDLSLLLVMLFITLFVASCDDDDDTHSAEIVDEQLAGELRFANFTIPAGQRVEITDDVTITVTQRVDIGGELVAADSSGQSITLIATGDVAVSGLIRAGDSGDLDPGGDLAILSTDGTIRISESAELQAGQGFVGSDGGDLILNAESQDLQILSGAVVAAGDGGDGVLDGELLTVALALPAATEEKGVNRNAIRRSAIDAAEISGGGGGKGGDLALLASNGAVVIGDEAELRLGRGGDGADIRVTESAPARVVAGPLSYNGEVSLVPSP